MVFNLIFLNKWYLRDLLKTEGLTVKFSIIAAVPWFGSHPLMTQIYSAAIKATRVCPQSVPEHQVLQWSFCKSNDGKVFPNTKKLIHHCKEGYLKLHVMQIYINSVEKSDIAAVYYAKDFTQFCEFKVVLSQQKEILHFNKQPTWYMPDESYYSVSVGVTLAAVPQ